MPWHGCWSPSSSTAPTAFSPITRIIATDATRATAPGCVPCLDVAAAARALDADRRAAPGERTAHRRVGAPRGARGGLRGAHGAQQGTRGAGHFLGAAGARRRH